MSKEDKDDLEKILGSVGTSEHSEGIKGDLDVYVHVYYAFCNNRELQYYFIRFNGVNVRPGHLQGLDAASFQKKLIVSLKHWQSEGRRGIWIKIPTEQSELIPITTKVVCMPGQSLTRPDHCILCIS